MFPLPRQRLLPISRTRKATSTNRTDCDRFTIMNSWTIRLFERLTSAVFARQATIIGGTGGVTPVCGERPAPRGAKAASSDAGGDAGCFTRRASIIFNLHSLGKTFIWLVLFLV